MDPVTAALVAQGLATFIEIWRVHANKPAEWQPTDQEWDDLMALASKEPDDYKREAAQRLGIAWPPPTQ